MKILVITRNAWDDTNAIGNTLSNFFTGIDDLEFAAVYFRSAEPNNELCETYYNASEIEILRNWFKPSKIGKSFQKTYGAVSQAQKNNREKKMVRLVQRYGIKLAYKISDFLWYSKKWINGNLDSFIEKFSPDIVVTFVKSAPQYYLTVKHLREKYDIPLFSWIADDEYTSLKKRKSHREIENLRYILNESAVVFGCSVELCEYYNLIFGCHATPLYKGCNLEKPLSIHTNDQIEIVYAGNLLYGRLEIISKISKALAEINSNGRKIAFEVYSNTALLDSEIQTHFGEDSFARYMGKKSYDFIKNRLSKADIVLHVESFEEDQIIKTKYSFSTKIIDYLQSGSVILAVGPNEVSSMKYIAKIPGTCVINNMSDLKSGLQKLFDDASNYKERIQQTRDFAERNHNYIQVSQQLKETFTKIAKKGV